MRPSSWSRSSPIERALTNAEDSLPGASVREKRTSVGGACFALSSEERTNQRMQREKSCGALVLRTAEDGQLYILMIRHKAGGHRSFPKGHMERGETEYMTAVREVFEETAVQIRIHSDFRETVHYNPMPGVTKEVVYFLTETAQTEIKPRQGEIAQVEWVPIEQAEASLTHENDKMVLRAALSKIERGEFLRKSEIK